MPLPQDRGGGQLHRSLNLGEVGDLPRVLHLELQLVLFLFEHLGLRLLELVRPPRLCGQGELLLVAILVILADGLGLLLPPFLLLCLDLGQRFLEEVFRYRVRLNLAGDLLGLRNNLRFRLCQVKRPGLGGCLLRRLVVVHLN